MSSLEKQSVIVWQSYAKIVSFKQRLDNQSKLTALNVLKVCREEKENGKLFLPLTSHLARASMLTGVPKGHVLDSEHQMYKKTASVKSDRINRTSMTLIGASFVGQSMICWFLGRCCQQ